MNIPDRLSRLSGGSPVTSTTIISTTLWRLSLVLLGTLFFSLCPHPPGAEARLRALPLPQKLGDCYRRAQNYSVQNYVGGTYCWYCEASVRAQVKGMPRPIKPQQYDYYRGLYDKVDPRAMRGKRQANRCIRKEYRMLSDAERTRFHGAVNSLKSDTTVEPNKYDALALFHTGIATFLAHGGPGFLGWHALYLMLFEAALQEVDPSVCLPYWDSSIDSGLENPTESYVWSDTFFGGLSGEVTRGAFGNWVTPEGMILSRGGGVDGELFTRQGIEAIMSRNSYEEIIMLDQDPQYNLEIQHGGAHVFVGGDLERLDTAAYDIIFFMHHAFVDYIWSLFREKMRNNGQDPERYPTSADLSDYHMPDHPMGFGNITQAEGYLESARAGYEYMPSPECSSLNTDCGSKYLWCDVPNARCLPIDPANPPFPPTTPGPLPRPLPPPPGGCKTSRPQAVQNNFCVNGACDVSLWVWVPVKIVAQRPPEFHDYPSYPVSNNKITKHADIYEPAGYRDTNRYIKGKTVKPKPYEECEIKDGVGKIFVSSMGVSYDGSYKESAIVDQRLATSISVTYIAVKDPGPKGVSQVILRAHDQCGRVCHTACRIPGTHPAKYESCSGVVEVTPDYPKLYGNTYAQATLDVYDYAGNSDCPSFVADDFFLTFYCDYRDHLPWVEKAPNPIGSRPSPLFPPSNSNECRLSSECTIAMPCYSHNNHHHHGANSISNTNPRQCEKYMEAHECLGNCGRYAVCIYGVYWPRMCPNGMHFSERWGKCVPGPCGRTGGGSLNRHIDQHHATNINNHNSHGLGGRGSSSRFPSSGSSSGGFGSLTRQLPGSPQGSARSPTAVSFGNGGYYGRLISNFKFGNRG